MFALLLPLLSSILPDVIRRVLPAEKISEADRATLEQQITLELMKQNWNGIEAEFRDRDSARQLAAAEIAKGNALTSFLAAVVRPLWGIGAFVLVAWSVYAGADIPEPLQSIIQTVLMFYFGGRVIEKVTPLLAGVLKPRS